MSRKIVLIGTWEDPIARSRVFAFTRENGITEEVHILHTARPREYIDSLDQAQLEMRRFAKQLWPKP